MACSIETQRLIKDAAKEQMKRLRKLQQEGFVTDTEQDNLDIEEALGVLKSIIQGKPEGVQEVEAGKDVTAEYGSSMDIAYNGSNKYTETAIKRVLDTGKYLVVETAKGAQYKFNKGQDRSVDTKSGKFVTVRDLGQKANYTKGTFGSDPRVDTHKAKYQKLEYDIWNDQDNALILFDKLDEIDGVQDEHTTYLRGLLEDITDPAKKILNEFKVYLNMEASQNSGAAHVYGKNPSLTLNINEGAFSGGMSATEAYLHEMIHMSVEAARHFKEGPLSATMSEMRKLYQKAAQEITVDDLIEGGDVERAKLRYAYMFDNEEAGIAEFIAYAMTNKQFKARLNDIKIGENKANINTETLWGKLVGFVMKVYEGLRDVVSTRDPKTPMDERVGHLVTQMWLLNNQTVQEARLLDKISAVTGTITDTTDKGILTAAKKAAKWTREAADYVQEKAGVESGVGKAVRRTAYVVDLMNPYAPKNKRDAVNVSLSTFSHAFGDSPLMRIASEATAPEGTLRSMLEYLKEDDSFATRIEKLGLLVKKIDQDREHVIAAVGADIMSKFGKIDHKDQEALTTALIETDVKALVDTYSMDEIKELLTSDEKLDKEIAQIEKSLDGISIGNVAEGGSNYYRAQAMLLGRYMATGMGDSSLNTNAQDIVGMRGTNVEVDVHSDKTIIKRRHELEKSVDKLATMHALKNASASAKNRTARMITEKSEAVENLLAFHELHEAEQFSYRIQSESMEAAVKGEIKDLKAAYTEVKLAPNDEGTRKRMKKMGFTYRGESNVEGVAVYKKWTAGQASFDKQAVAKINEHKDMFNLIGVLNTGSADYTVSTEKAKEELNNYHNKRKTSSLAQMNGTFDIENPDGLLAIRNRLGRLNNYGVTIDRRLYQDTVKQDKKAPVLLGKMIAEIGEKMRAKQHNSEVLRVLWKDMNDNYAKSDENGFGKNSKEYLVIGPDAKFTDKVTEQFAKRMWRDMPDNLKMAISAAPKGHQFIAVRRDLAYSIFGMRSPSVLDIKFPGMDDTIEHWLNKNNLGAAVEMIKLAGDVWQEIVSLIKFNIVIKTPMVIIENLLSNIVYAASLGQLDPITGMFNGFRDTKEYMDLEREKVRIKFDMDRGKASEKDRARYKQIAVLQKSNPVKPLIDAGLFTAVASDIAMVDMKSQTRLGSAIEKYTDKVPEVIKDGFSALYVTEGTGLQEAMLMATAYGDFVARVNRYQFLLAKGYAPSVAIKMVTDEMVNYNRLTGPLFTWLKETGIGQFIPYLLGSAKSLIEKLRDRPTSMLMMGMSGLSNPMDAMPWVSNSSRLHSPLEIMTDQVGEFVLTPASLRMAGIL